MDSFKGRVMATGVRVSKIFWLILVCYVALMAPTNAHAAYAFTPLDYPGAASTQVFGLNNAGVAAGTAYDASGNSLGFIAQAQSDGTYTFTPLPAAPGGYQTSALGINDAGTITGSAGPADGSVLVGFVLHGSAYTYFSYPSRTYTYARAINSAGVITGYADDGFAVNSVGFIYDPQTGVFTDITVPGAEWLIAQGVNTAGQVVGNGVLSTGESKSFLRDPVTGVLSYFQVNSLQTRARGINNMGLITGFARDASSGLWLTFVGNSNGYQLLPSTAAISTYAEAINDFGQISGLYSGTDGISHGFVATRFPSTKDECKNGGWQTFGVFKNQGDCVSFVATGGKKP